MAKNSREVVPVICPWCGEDEPEREGGLLEQVSKDVWLCSVCAHIFRLSRTPAEAWHPDDKPDPSVQGDGDSRSLDETDIKH